MHSPAGTGMLGSVRPSPMRFPSSPGRLAAFTLLWALAAAPCPLAAQGGAAKPANLFGDTGGFERSTVQDNLWDGVNGDGSLAGFPFGAEVVTEKGNLGRIAMPPSVAFVDLNGDGKPDLITADPTGFFRFYPNSGTATAPKFTSAEIMPIFVSTCIKPREHDYNNNDWTDEMRFCPRFALADWRHTGLLDLLVGNYYGEILFLPNTGNARQPRYQWPGSVDRLRVPTNDQGRLWANLLSPVGYDWTGHGRLDLLTGEGTYSANAIHLLENVGSGDTPKFSSAPGKHTYLAYGDGREQLIPTVVDYDGDGKPDLLVADRTGEVGVYLNTGKPGEELKRASTLTFGSTSRLPGLCSLYAADYNGDGLFDLIVGLPNGHIAVALNTGTKTEPKFGLPQDIKGEDRLKHEIHSPDGWATNLWTVNGNALGYANVVNNQSDPASNPPEGTSCLKMGYWPTAQQTFPMPAEGIPGTTQHITLIRRGLTLNIGKHYHLAFKGKGGATQKLHWEIRSFYYGRPTTAKVERDERGGVRRGAGGVVEELQSYGQDFSVSGNWSAVDGDLTPRWKNPALSGEKTMAVTLYVEFYATNLTGNLYLDDFVLSEAP